MPARDPFSETDLPKIHAALASFSTRDRALILLGLHTGFRARELGNLTIAHVVADDGSIRTALSLERRHLKHGSGVYRKKIRTRTVPLAPNARAALEEYVTERRAAGTAQLEAPLIRSLKIRLRRWVASRLSRRPTRPTLRAENGIFRRQTPVRKRGGSSRITMRGSESCQSHSSTR